MNKKNLTEADIRTKFITPAIAGKGDFMSCAINHLRRQAKTEDYERFIQDCFSGIKDELLQKCNLHTIVSLPNVVFIPYRGIRINLLFFTKGQPTTAVWYYAHPYPNGAKSYNIGKPVRIEKFEPERAWWDNRTENELAWRVSIDQIKADNYHLYLKNPHVSDTGPGDVDHLLPKLPPPARN